MTAIALNTADRTRRLFDEADVSVSGNVSKSVKYKLLDMGKMADAAIENSMMGDRLYTDYKPTRMNVKYIDTQNGGIVNASTNGERMGINSAVVSGTREYEDFIDSYRNMDNEWGNLIMEGYGTPERADITLQKTIYHERNHDKKQFSKLRNKYGKEAEQTFVEAAFDATKDYISKVAGLPKDSPWTSFLAEQYFREPVEGINELDTDNLLEGLSNYQLHEVGKRNVRTTYDMFEVVSAYVIDTLGFDTANEFYEATVDNPGLIRKYVEGFMNYNGGTLPANRQMTLQPAPRRNAA